MSHPVPSPVSVIDRPSAGDGFGFRVKGGPRPPVRPVPSQGPSPFAVLAIVGDRETGVSVAESVSSAGVQVEAVGSGVGALAIGRSHPFDLMLIDQRLPDMPGTELVARLLSQEATADVPFILISGATTLGIAIEVIRLRAVSTADLRGANGGTARRIQVRPLQPERVVERSPEGIEGRITPTTNNWSQMRPRSAAERWARLVLKACEAEGDLRTLDDWATFVGVSYSSLCEMCRVVDIRPHDARDFTRMLRAVIKAAACRSVPSVLLDVSDRRTLRNLLARAGLRSQEDSPSVERFLRDHQFVARDNEGLTALRGLLGVT